MRRTKRQRPVDACLQEMHAELAKGGASMAAPDGHNYQRAGRGGVVCQRLGGGFIVGSYVPADEIDTALGTLSDTAKTDLRTHLATYDPQTTFLFCLQRKETARYSG